MPRKEVLGRRPNHHNLKNRFELVRTLGQGTYGKVQLAIEKSSGIQYAIKTIKKQKIANEHDKTRIHREIELMTHLSHPHITSVYEVFENSEKIVLVMEYASGGELYDYINDKQGLYEEEARKFFRQIASAAYYLHMNGIVHRDLKLENIVLDKKGNAMLADFGLANIYSKDELLSTYCGSPLYASPEIVNGLPYTGPEVDCWSLGVLLFTLVYGAMPFDGSDFRKLRNQITAGNYYEPEPSSDAAGLIRFILTPNPAKRATIHDICDHWWTNVGYEHNPVEETRPGKPVNFSALKKLLSDGYHSSDSEGDSPKKKPIKGILKKPKSKQEAKQYTSEVDTGACGDQLHSNDTKDLVSNKEKTSKQKSSVSNGHDRYTNKGKGSMGKTTRSKEPKKGILKHTKMPCQAASDSGCVVDENVCECADIQKQISAASLDSGVGGNSKTNVNCAQSTDELCEKCVDKKGNHIDYNLDDIDSILDEIQLFDYNQPANDDSVEVAKSSISDHIQGDQSADNAAFQCANNGPDKSLEPEGDACILHNQDTPTSDKTIFQSARNTARELFDSLRASMSARRKRGITKRPASTSSSVDSSWRHSMGSAGSSSSGDLLDLSYESGEGDSESTGHTTPQPAFSLLPFDLISGEDLSSPGGSQDQGPSVLLQDEKDCDEVFGPPPPLPTSPPPSSSIKPCLPEDAESSVEPGEICFEDSDEYEPGEVHYSGSSGINTICIGYNTEEFISKMLEEDYAPEEVRKDAITPSLFDLAEARGVYQKAVGLCNK